MAAHCRQVKRRPAVFPFSIDINSCIKHQPHTLDIATLDSKGEPVSIEQLDVRLYKLSWKWWWDQGRDTLASFETAASHTALRQATLSSKDGAAKWEFQLDHPEWGR